MIRRLISGTQLNIVFSLLLAAAVLLIPAVPVYAAPVEVDLGETASTGWNIGPIFPGASGTQTIVLSNAGESSGILNIWISNIIDTEGTPADFADSDDTTEGELSQRIMIGLNASGLSSTLSLPALLSDFPAEVDSDNYLSIPSVASGETVTLNWTWYLPIETGNEVQGDSLSFDINYTLTEIVTDDTSDDESNNGGGGGGGGADEETTEETQEEETPEVIDETQYITLEFADISAAAPVDESGIIDEALVLNAEDNSFSLMINKGTQITASNQYKPEEEQVPGIEGQVPEKITIGIAEQERVPSVPDGWVRVSPAYDINGLTDEYLTGVKLSTAARMVIQYDAAELPEYLDTLATFYYNYESGWTQLQPPQGFIAEAGESAAETDHFSLFAVLAQTGDGPNPPANIMVQKCTIYPERIVAGETADVRVRATNSGGMAGECTVSVKLNGAVIQSRVIILKPGESKNIFFSILAPSSGVYSVEAAATTTKLVVEPQYTPDVKENDYLWLLVFSVGVSFLLFGLAGLRRRYYKPEEETEDK